VKDGNLVILQGHVGKQDTQVVLANPNGQQVSLPARNISMQLFCDPACLEVASKSQHRTALYPANVT